MKLFIVRGSDTQTLASASKDIVDYEANVVRVNKDDLCAALGYNPSSKAAKQLHSAVLRRAFEDGYNVVTEFHPSEGARELERITGVAAEYGVAVRYREYDDDPAPKVMPRNYKPVLPKAGAPTAVIVDTDGTVALHVNRSPYDTSQYHTDEPNHSVIEMVHCLLEAGHVIIGVSGRSEEFREVTEAWWTEHVGFVPEKFYMRHAGDKRDDALVKYELYAEHIGPNYRVVGVFDDRPRVLRMWRQVGLPTFQVGDGKEF